VQPASNVLIVTFPYSNMRYMQAYHGETAECITHGLRTIFDHIGGTPRHLIFENVPRNIFEVMCPAPLCGAASVDL